MNLQSNQAPALSAAFAAFNEHSTRLEASYQELRSQVEALTARLLEERSARRAEHLEREKLDNRLLRIVEALPGGLIVLDGEGIIQECNQHAERLLNCPLVGLPWSRIVNRECEVRSGANGELWLKSGQSLSLSRQTLAPEQGEILLLTDVTDSRRLAEMMQRAERLTTLGEMTACLAHQIRTPLASALLNVGLLRGGQRQQQVADRLRHRIHDVMHIVDDMLRFAAGAKRKFDEFSVAELLEEVADAHRVGSSKDRLSVDVADQSLRLAGDREALKGALQNLIDNACQSSDAPVHIVVGAAVCDTSVFLRVADNGPGLPDASHERLFEPFFTTRPQGTGLGLAVVQSVVDAHGGEVIVESTERGATFTLCLPLSGEA